MIELPKIPMTKKRSHSFSAMNTFATICERRYALERNRPWTDNVNTLRGAQIHAALEWVVLQWSPQEALDIEGLLYDASCEFHDGCEESMRSFEKCDMRWPLTQPVLLQWLLRTLPALERITPIGEVFVPGEDTEFWIKKSIPGCAWPLYGKVDLRCRLDGLPTVWDWKSTANMNKVLTQYECDRSLQGRIYSWATGIRRVAFGFFSPYHNVQVVTSTYSDEDIEELELWLSVTGQAIEGRWKTNLWTLAQPTCGLCSETWCPEWKECVGCVRTSVGSL